MNYDVTISTLPFIFWVLYQGFGLFGMHRNHNETMVRDQSISKSPQAGS